jgi:hypothetical protein
LLERDAFNAALARLTDVKALGEIALSHQDDEVRLTALGKIEDPAELARVGMGLKGKGAFVEKAAPILLAGVSDAARLAELVKSAADTGLKQILRRQITDPAVVARVLKDAAPEDYAVTYDLLKVRDQTLLAELATSAAASRVRSEAASRLRDTAALAKIAKADADAKVRTAATERLSVLKRKQTITGSLVEPALGRPLAGFTIDIGKDTLPISETVTDANGAFTIDDARPGRWYVRHKGQMMQGPKGYLDVTVPATGGVTLGRVEMHVDEAVTEAFADACGEKGLGGRVPEAKLLVFFDRENRWVHSHETVKKLGWDGTWKGALCIHSHSSKVGEYRTATGASAGGAYSTRWSVRLVRLDDGKSFEKAFRWDPPQQATTLSGGYALGGSGDPSAEVRDWLKTIP